MLSSGLRVSIYKDQLDEAVDRSSSIKRSLSEGYGGQKMESKWRTSTDLS